MATEQRKRLSVEEIKAVEDRWRAGETLLELCTAYDCVPETLRRGLRKRGWDRPLNTFSKEKCEVTVYRRGYLDGYEERKAEEEEAAKVRSLRAAIMNYYGGVGAPLKLSLDDLGRPDKETDIIDSSDKGEDE